MIKYIEEKQKFVIEIVQLKELRREWYSYSNNISNINQRKKYYDSLIIFFDWYIFDYCPSILKQKKFTDKHISECIFKENFKNKCEHQEFLLKSLYVSKQYVEYLKTNIKEVNLKSYERTLIGLQIDIESLIANIEIVHKGFDTEISLNSWRKKDLTPKEIYSAAQTLFFIEEFESIEDLHLRGLKPLVMFQIRQLLEIFGKNLIGYYYIFDENGNIIKKFTQIAWEFIKEEVRKPNSRIELTFDIFTISSIMSWSNNFVHTTYLYNSYIQFFALKTIDSLFLLNNNTNYKGNKCNYPAKIINYGSLKTDFESYLKNKNNSLDISVEWMDIDRVGACIISE